MLKLVVVLARVCKITMWVISNKHNITTLPVQTQIRYKSRQSYLTLCPFLNYQ